MKINISKVCPSQGLASGWNCIEITNKSRCITNIEDFYGTTR
jgi:hypothetical protein